jgi:glucose/arabinose dehydrogenase
MVRMRSSLPRPAAAAAWLGVALALAAPRCPETGIAALRVASGLDQPVYAAAPPGDERLFIVERTGRIRILDTQGLRPTPFLDLSAWLPPQTAGETRGLIGLAFPRDYASTGLFYVSFDRFDGALVLARHRVSADPDVAEPNPLVFLTQVFPPTPARHGGHIEFAGDGMLLMAIGDGGIPPAQGDPSQATNGFLGKVLRLDVSGGPRAGYRIPPDNPSFGPFALRELWAIGLRDPRRFHADPLSGLLLVGDAGQAREELDVEMLPQGGGRNWGWRKMDGSACLSPATGCNDGTLSLPLLEIPHRATGCPALVAGKTYYGRIFEIWGHHFQADACTGEISSVRLTVDRRGDAQVAEQRDWSGELAPDEGSIDSVAGFGFDGDGELYIVDPDGEVFQIVPRSVPR